MAVKFVKVGAHESVRVRILAYPGVSINGMHAGYGDVLHVPAHEAIFLIGARRAEQVDELPPPVEVRVVEKDPEPEPATETPQEVKSTKGAKRK